MPAEVTLALEYDGGSVAAALAPIDYTPAQIRTAYGINNLPTAANGHPLDGTGQTIAIVVAYDDPNIFQDVDGFDQQFGVTSTGPTLYDQYGPASSFLKVLNQDGQATPLPGTDPTGPTPSGANWEGEEAMNVEWAHAIAPGAKIDVIECNSPDNLDAAAATAAGLPGVSVVAMSFGGPEASSDLSENSFFTTPVGHPGVTFLAASGDAGINDAGYPAFSPNVVAVGGTSLTIDYQGNYQSETGWSLGSVGWNLLLASGGGISSIETEPSYQLSGVQTTGNRTIPDVSLVADPNTGVAKYDSYNQPLSNPWELGSGTSLATPCWAGLIALVNQGRAAAGYPTLNSSSNPVQTLSALYSLPSKDFHNNLGGNNGTSSNGITNPAIYNEVTGLGSPVANLVLPDLINYGKTTTSLSSSANPSGTGQVVTFGATVASASSEPGTPTGTIQFQVDGQDLGSPIPLIGGTATSPGIALTAGSHTVTANYVNVDGNFLNSHGSLSQAVYPPPVAGIVGSADGVLYQPWAFTFTAIDQPGDAAAGFTYAITWGDGSPVQKVAAKAYNTPMTAFHAYTKTGTFIVAVTATDQFGGTSAVASEAITIGIAEVQADPSAKGGITGLAISAVSGTKGVVLAPTGSGYNIKVTRDGKILGTFTATNGTVAIYGDGGTDLVTLFGLRGSANTFTLTGSTATFTAASISPNGFTIGLNSVSTITLAGEGNANAFTNTAATVASMLIGSSDGPNTYTFAGASMGAATTIQGHDDVNTVTGPNQPNVWNVTGNGTGNLNGTNWSFRGVQNLIGGSQTNDFIFSKGVTLAGNLDGGGGGTLDESQYKSAVSVNLQTSKASGVGGEFSNLVAAIGGSGANRLTGADTANTWNITGANAGNVNGSFAFTAFALLTGGAADNYFVFSDGAGVSGKITGSAGGSNRLDYTAYSTGVYVNMASQVATGTGGFSNIEQVFGGNGNDVLVGAGSGILLQEAAGNNLIIGGSGQATIQSGSGQDIVLAGSTSYDTKATSLQAIESYWATTSIALAIRVAQLSGRGSPIGHHPLNPATVKHAGFGDTLTLGSANDWVFWRMVGTDEDAVTGKPEQSTII